MYETALHSLILIISVFRLKWNDKLKKGVKIKCSNKVSIR